MSACDLRAIHGPYKVKPEGCFLFVRCKSSCKVHSTDGQYVGSVGYFGCALLFCLPDTRWFVCVLSTHTADSCSFMFLGFMSGFVSGCR